MEQYVVTGIGVHNGLGHSAEISWANLLAGKTAIRPVKWPEDDPTKFPSTHSGIKIKLAAINNEITEDYPDYFSYGWPYWDPNTKSCLLSVDEAIKDSNLTSKRVGVAVSTFGSGTQVRLEFFAALNLGKKASPRKTLNMGLDFPAAQVAKVYGVIGPNTTMNSACTTGITSIEYAINTLKTDTSLDAMIVGGADYTADAIYMFWFQSLGALSQTDDVSLASCPFDRRRNGFVMGEGAATIIIEPLSKARARGAKIYGIVKSTSFVTLFDSDTSPDPSGQGARLCVQQALDKAGITADQIDYVNAHATSTPIGDQIEFDAMLDLTPGRVMVSNKGQIGHTMASSGIVETIYSLLTIRDQRTPGTANLLEPLGQGMILPADAVDVDVKYIIKNSFGFGGRNASMVLEKYND
jgi:3-oxoacyl-[acyl-carrier-protein] synthase II